MAGLKGFQLSIRLEIEPQCELCNAVATNISVGLCGLSEDGAVEVFAAPASSPGILKVRMVEQVKEIGIKPEFHPLVDPEGLAYAKINVCVHWSRQ